VTSPIELSLVVPCLNEVLTLGSVIEKSQRALQRLGISGEIVVADNGSTDGSIELATRLGARVVPVQAKGYGNAVRAGLNAGQGRFLLMGDADDTYDFSELDGFVAALRGGADFVMGTRLPPGRMMPGANPFLNRYLGTPVLTFVLNRLFGLHIHDVNCGMRALTRDALARLDLRSEGMELASEMVIKAGLHDLRVAEVPVTLHPDRRGRPSHLRRWRDGWRHLEFMLLHAPDPLLFWPGVVMGVLGLLLALPVAVAPLTLFGHLFDYHFLILGGSMALIGLQGLLGALIARNLGALVAKPSRWAQALARRFTFLRALGVAGLLFGVGFGLDAWVLVIWIGRHFGPLHEIRRVVLGLLLMSAGAQVALFGFLHAVLRKHLFPMNQGA
jgi:glycosyltransferase involved in cell wall biosynthesis